MKSKPENVTDPESGLSAPRPYKPKPPSDDAMGRWGHLTNEQLQGAEYALRILETSPAIKGRGLEVLRGILMDCWDIMGTRKEGRNAK